MKLLFKNWKKFLLQEDINDYVFSNENIKLYHFSKEQGDSLMLDPQYFLTKRQHYSRNDYRVSDMPRVFFYMKKEQAEEQVKQDSALYSATVPAEQIYDLTTDPLDLKNKSMSQFRVTPDYDRILRSLANKPRQSKYGSEPESLLSPEESNYKGARYKTGDMDIVVWFEPIEVTKHKLEGGLSES